MGSYYSGSLLWNRAFLSCVCVCVGGGGGGGGGGRAVKVHVPFSEGEVFMREDLLRGKAENWSACRPFI